MEKDRVALGSAIFALHDPHPGHERDFNRWYERDHMYAGAVLAPWVLSAQRWVATAPLKDLRYPAEGPFGASRRGSYLAVYWIQEGRLEDQQAFAMVENAKIAEQGRNFEHRDAVSATTYQYAGGIERDPDGVPPELALEHRYPGLVWAVVERTGAPLEDLRSWLIDEHLPSAMAGSPIALSLLFTPLPKADWWPKAAPEVPGVGDRFFLMFFLEADPRACWDDQFKSFGKAVEGSGLGRALLVAPFIPTVPGTDIYTDQLF